MSKNIKDKVAEIMRLSKMYDGHIWTHSYANVAYIYATDNFDISFDINRRTDALPVLSFGMIPNIENHPDRYFTGSRGITLNRLFVPPTLRQRGCGTKLMQFAIELGQQTNETLYLVPGYNPMLEPCLGPNELVNWYRRLGFKLIPGLGGGTGSFMRKIPRSRLDQEVTRKIGKPRMGWIKWDG